MTGPESVDIRALKAELLHEIQALRDEVAPAMRLSASVARINETASDLGRFLKWGVGVGAGLATIYIGFHAAGIV